MNRMIKTVWTLLVLATALPVVATSLAAEEAVAQAESEMHRYMVVRTFPVGALEGLDDEGKQAVNAKNEANGVRWIQSYANADLTKTFCIYEGPSKRAVRLAAAANEIPVDYIVEIPVDLMP